MKKGKDISVTLAGLYLVHQNLPGKAVDFHNHKEAILFIPIQGEIAVLLKGRELKCGPGKMIYLPGNTPHAFKSSSLLGERLIAMFPKIKAPEPKVLPTLQLCKELFYYLLLNPKSKHVKTLVSVAIHTLEESLSSETDSELTERVSSRIIDPRIRKAYEMIEEKSTEKISMEQLAKNSGLSTRNFNRLFLQEVGMSPKGLQSSFRVMKAKELLASGKHSVTNTAFEVGYESLSQFIEVFRKITGTLPSQHLRN